MKHLVALRHVAFEDLGYFENIFQNRGYKITYMDAGKDDLVLIHSIDPDILVICGGPISVNDQDLYPFLIDEFKIVESRLKKKKCTLGLCLGAQVIAKVLGARVYPAKSKEIGWAPILLTKEGKRSPIRFLTEGNAKVFHWHGETFDLPKEATLLASTPICENQAFTYEDHTLALQFHPEVIPNHLEQWYIGHTAELSQTKGIDIHQMRLEAIKWGALLKQQGEKFLNEWISNLGLK
jgi:GMP synthase (glutamine-hydrolysing)